MTNVTQLIPSYLGGVSKQTDDKINPGQCRELINTLPDATYGLRKRNGFYFNRVVANSELTDATFFTVIRGGLDAWIGYVLPNGNTQSNPIVLNNAVTGVPAVIEYEGSSKDYLTGKNRTNYSFTTIQDVTVLTNKTMQTAMGTAPTYTATGATVKLTQVDYGASYSVTIQVEGGNPLTTAAYKTRNADDLSDPTVDRLDADEILTQLKSNIEALNISGLTVTLLTGSLELKLSSGSFKTIDAEGGISGKALSAYIDNVRTVADLADFSVQDRLVLIQNSSQKDDDYFLKYVAADGISGPGEYRETTDPRQASEMDASTLPHELVFDRVENNTTYFKFQEIDWKERDAGDDVTNPIPSFITTDTKQPKFVNYTFFYNNRFGILSSDNVILSQANDTFNFFSRTAQTSLDSDPIDINVASTSPVLLNSVITQREGIYLFSSSEQFVLFSNTEFLTPSSSIVRSVSKYEIDSNIDTVDLGTSFAFISKVPGYSRVFAMTPRGLEEPPVVVDIGKVVQTWISSNITSMNANPQNQFLMLSSSESDTAYLYKYFNTGERDLYQGWQKWELPGNCLALFSINDDIFAITQQQNQVTLLSTSINELNSNELLIAKPRYEGNPTVWANPKLDMMSNVGKLGQATMVFDGANNQTVITLPYTDLTDKEPIVIATWDNPNATARTRKSILDLIAPYQNQNLYNASDLYESGYYVVPERSGNTFILKGDWTDEQLVVGYRFNYIVEIPTIYYNLGESKYDFTSRLTIARCKFSIGLSGSVKFELRSMPVNGASSTWKPIKEVAIADYYQANNAALVESTIHTIPVHQRNTNFNLRIHDNSPFPASLVQMMWEGNYVPRFYRRRN